MEKAVAESVDVEWALRFYNQQNKTRHSRLSFYTFNLGSPAHEGNGSYMEYGVSKNDETPIELGQWVFVVGEAEPWISPSDLSTGCALWKQGVAAKRELADKYGDFGVQPQHGSGSITVGGSQETGFLGAIAHLAIWNRLLSDNDIASIWSAGAIVFTTAVGLRLLWGRDDCGRAGSFGFSPLDDRYVYERVGGMTGGRRGFFARSFRGRGLRGRRAGYGTDRPRGSRRRKRDGRGLRFR